MIERGEEKSLIDFSVHTLGKVDNVIQHRYLTLLKV